MIDKEILEEQLKIKKLQLSLVENALTTALSRVRVPKAVMTDADRFFAAGKPTMKDAIHNAMGRGKEIIGSAAHNAATAAAHKAAVAGDKATSVARTAKLYGGALGTAIKGTAGEVATDTSKAAKSLGKRGKEKAEDLIDKAGDQLDVARKKVSNAVTDTGAVIASKKSAAENQLKRVQDTLSKGANAIYTASPKDVVDNVSAGAKVAGKKASSTARRAAANARIVAKTAANDVRANKDTLIKGAKVAGTHGAVAGASGGAVYAATRNRDNKKA